VNKLIQRVAISAALVASASTWAASVKDKVAVFDVQEAILTTNMAKEQMKAFESRADVAKMMADGERLKKEITALRDEATKEGAAWPAAKANEKKKAIEFKEADFELIVRKLNSERQASGKKLMDDIGPRLEGIVKEIVEADGIGLLLDRKAAIHAEPGWDITAKVTEKLNAAAVGKK
jgi:outer membrane protein